MIVQRLVWPVLQHRFQDPHAPDWFRRRVWARFRADRPPLPHRPRIYLLVLLPVAVLVLVLLTSKLSVLGLTNIVSLGLACGGLFVLVPPEVRAIRAVLATGQAAYDRAADRVRVEMTGHERLLLKAQWTAGDAGP